MSTHVSNLFSKELPPIHMDSSLKDFLDSNDILPLSKLDDRLESMTVPIRMLKFNGGDAIVPSESSIKSTVPLNILDAWSVDREGTTLGAILERWINRNFTKPFYLIAASTIVSSIIKTTVFSYEFLNNLAIANATTPFILVSGDGRLTLGFDYDLDYFFVSSSSHKTVISQDLGLSCVEIISIVTKYKYSSLITNEEARGMLGKYLTL